MILYYEFQFGILFQLINAMNLKKAIFKTVNGESGMLL